jgi:pyruvate dehydrogenase E1 component
LVTRLLSEVGGPIIAVTDFMKLVPDQVHPWVPGPFTTLGTDGFGRSDARKALRRFFEVDTGHIVAASLATLAAEEKIDKAVVSDAHDRYQIDPEAPDPAVGPR